MRRKNVGILPALVVVTSLSEVANAAVIGRPVSLDIRITQGSDLVSEALNLTISGADPLDGKTYYPIGVLGGGLSTVYLSVQMQHMDQAESWIAFYVRTGDPLSPLVPGSSPLFDLLGLGMIDVVIDDLQFMDGSQPSDVTVAQFPAPLGDYMAGMYMMDSAGWYYALPETTPWWIGSKLTHQVPYAAFRDGDPNVYYFKIGSGTEVDIGWYHMPSPVDDTYTKIQSDFPYASALDTTGGAVFEMGLNAFVYHNIPEPATVGLFLTAGLVCLRRRRR